jgi:hypothetical protein
VFNESDIRKTGNLFMNNNQNNNSQNHGNINNSQNHGNNNNRNNNHNNGQQQNMQNNNIISLIQGKNELKEYEMNIQSPTEKRSTYYLSNQFSNKVKFC